MYNIYFAKQNIYCTFRMALSSAAYGLGVVFTTVLGSIPLLLARSKTPVSNPLYGTTSTLLLTYSIGASLLMYVMMLYFFTAFPTHAPLFILLFDVLLMILSLWTMFFNPWKVIARREGASGVNARDPSFLSAAISSGAIPILYLLLLYIFQNSENRLVLLLLTNLLVIPFFFLTSGMINSFALNDFTHNF
jgi:hypothetical protein